MHWIFRPRPVIHREITWLLLFSIFSLGVVSWLIYNRKSSIERSDAGIRHAYEAMDSLREGANPATGVLYERLQIERRILGERLRSNERANDRTALMLVLGRVAGFLLVAVILVRLNKDISGRKRMEVEVEQSVQQLLGTLSRRDGFTRGYYLYPGSQGMANFGSRDTPIVVRHFL